MSSSTDPAFDIAQLLDQIPITRGEQRVVTPIDGGLTNESLRVQIGSRDLLVRVFASDMELFGIDREVEVFNTQAASRSGVAPPLKEVHSELGVMVSAFVPGRTLSSSDLVQPSTRARVVKSIQTLHSGGDFQGSFDLRQFRTDYLGQVRQLGLALPSGYDEHLPRIEDIDRLLACSPEPLVPCHNDLAAENMIDTGDWVWIVDYEFAAMNEASFELANLGVSAEFDDKMVAALVADYWGSRDAAKLARTLAWMVTATFAWVPWAAIQSSTSSVDFDFTAWAQSRYERAASHLQNSDFWERLAVLSD